MGVVSRCVCRDVSFEEIVRLGCEEGLSLEQVRSRTGFGTGCGTCELYVRVAVATGRTALPVMTSAQAYEVLASTADARSEGA